MHPLRHKTMSREGSVRSPASFTAVDFKDWSKAHMEHKDSVVRGQKGEVVGHLEAELGDDAASLLKQGA